MHLAPIVHDALGQPDDIAVVAYDGTRAGPIRPDARAVIDLRSPDALLHVVRLPGELGLVRGIVSGDLSIEGDLYTVLDRGFTDESLGLKPKIALQLAREAVATPGLLSRLRRLRPPPEEVHLGGTLHSPGRDASAISHHYDVSNDFYRLFLGPSMTYSCAVFTDPDTPLEDAQQEKYDLVCRKLGLRPGMRLLDVGCGWGGMALHAASAYGVEVVGVTISREQVELAAKRVADAGLDGQVSIRLQDYRAISDGPFDAISSIGMFEHVGRRQLDTYVRALFSLLRPGGRLLNHAIGRPAVVQPDTASGRARLTAQRILTAIGSSRPSRITDALIAAYVFPDGELHEVGTVVSGIQEAGFEVRHLESLREHYAITLRHWSANLDQRWDEAVELVGPRRAQVWRLYLTACALAFEHGSTQIHQVLAVRPDDGRSGLPLRPSFEPGTLCT